MKKLVLFLLLTVLSYAKGYMHNGEIKDGPLTVGQLRPDICPLPQVKGMCEEKLKRFFYNTSTEICEEFVYSGCDGNGNNFLTVRDCHNACYPKPVHQTRNESELNETDDVSKTFKCPKDGLYRSLESCARFILCANGHPHEQPCPEGLHFKQESQKCEVPCQAGCDQNLAQECGWNKEEKEFACLEEKLLPDHKDCNRYIMCSGKRHHSMKCPPGLHFSEEKERCLPPCDAKCDRHIHCEMEIGIFGFQCPKKDGKYADRFDCSIYHECKNSSHKIKSCRTGKYFDSKKGACTAVRRARCLFHCEKPDGKIAHPENCELFISCRNNKPAVRRCAAGKAFHVTKRKCLKMEKTKCNKNELHDIFISRENI